jgi:hypothetical protein
MTSQLKSETARINGAKSKGPKTPETRAKSARNGVKHGLTAVSTIILACESEDEFNKLLAQFVASHLPVGAAEQDTVEQMAVARWRARRIRTAETALVDVEMARRGPETDKEFPGADPGVHLGLALKALSDESNSLALFSRYESRHERVYHRAYRTLRELQAARKAHEPKQPEGAPTPPPDGPKSEVHNPVPTTEQEPTPKSDLPLEEPKSELQNPAPAGQPESASEIRCPKSSFHSKSLKSSGLSIVRGLNQKLPTEPTVPSLRRRFRVRHSLLARSAAKKCGR